VPPPPSSSLSLPLPPPPSPPPPPPSLPPPITSAALRLPEASTKAFECRASRKESASNRGTAADADRLRACLARASPLPWLLSSLPPVRQVVRDQNLCTLQRKLVSNHKSKEWSMLGSGKHFAIGKKEARRVWYLRVDCACCTQEAVAPP